MTGWVAGAAPAVWIDLLGRFAVPVDGRAAALAFGGRKTRLLLRVPATRRGSPVDTTP